MKKGKEKGPDTITVRIIMKRFSALLLAVILVCSLLFGCSKDSSSNRSTDNTNDTSAANSEKTDLIIFAAASMTETLNTIKETYETLHPDINLVYTFDSSGTLKTQIENDAPCDLFISAANKQMDQLDAAKDAEKNPDGLDYILSDTRVDLLENKVALCVSEGNPKKINSYEDFANALKNDDILMAMGNEDVPVGQYTQKILAYYDLSEKDLASEGKITYGSNVKEVTTQISEGTVDCGIIYATDAFSANLSPVDTATEEMCGKVIYPAAVLKNSSNVDKAKEFLEYLKTKDAADVFAAVGFTPLSE